jgi:4-hydroxy-tetrahydrodipicolinate reductase
LSSRKRVLVHGAMGRMGVCIRKLLTSHEHLVLATAVDAEDHYQLGTELEEAVPLGCDADAAAANADVAISFSLPTPSIALVRACVAREVPCVVGTTGFDPLQQAELAAAGARIPLVVAANFSVAVNVLFRLVRQAAEQMGEGYDAEIFELHHNQKVDAPSGTALALGQAVADGRGVDFLKVALRDRDGISGPRPAGAIGLQALRGGDVAGEHSVLFIGGGERLELSHRASTRDHFARGALRAASWAVDRDPGLYDMEQVLGLR